MKRRPWLRLAVWTGGALIGVAAAAVLAATALGPAISRERIEAGLGAALGRPVRVGTVRLQPWLLRLGLRDVELLGEKGAGAIERLRAPRVDASLAISSIWRRQIVLSVHAHALDVSIDAGGPSTGRSPFPLPETFDLGPVEARLGTLAATGARVEVRDAGRGFALQAAGAEITARPEKGDLDVHLDVERVRVEAHGVREEFARLTANGRLAADRVDVRKLAWRWHDRPMSVEGQVRAPWGSSPELALSASGELPLAELTRRAGVDAAVGGVARLVASADGPVGALRIGGRLTAEPLAIAGAALDRVAVDARWEAGALRLDAIQASLGTGRLRARATVEPLPGSPTRVSVEIDELALPPPLARLRDGAGAIEARVAGGALEVTRARVAWPGATLGLEGRAGAGGEIAGQLSLTADLAAVAIAPAVSAGRVELRGQVGGRLAAPALAGRLDLTALVVGGRAVEPVAARFQLAAPPPDRAPRRWDLVIDAPRIASRALTVEDIRGAAALTRAGIDITDFQARASGVPLRLTGSWRWDGTGRGKVGFEPVALERVPALPPALALAGSARGEADVTIAGGEASVAGAVQLDRLSALGVGLGQGRIDVRLRGAALTAELALPARRARVEARGQLAAGGVIAVRLDVGELGLKALIAESSPGAADLIDGRVSAKGELTIPFDHPDAATGTVRVEPAGLVLLGDPWTSRGPIALRWQRGDLALESLRLEGPAGTLTGSGALGGASPAQIALALDGARLPGALAGIGRGTARAELRGRASEVELTRLEGQWPGLSLTATGRAGGAGLGALRAQLSADLARVTLPGAPPASGAATAVIEARGPWSALEATARVRAPAIQIAGAPVADVDVPLRLERRTLRAEGARARIGESRIAADATATLPDGIPLTAAAVAREIRFAAQARAPALRMEDIAALLPPAARGRGELTVAARAEGTGRAWRGTASAAGSRAEVAGTALRQVNATAAFDGTRIEVTELRAEAQDLPLRATATWQWAGGGRASATVGPGPLAGLGPRDLGLAGTGRASLELTARATPALVVDGTAQAIVEGLAISGVTLGRGRADVALRDGGFRATLGFPEQQLTATAEGTVGAGGAVQLGRAEIATREGALTAAGTIGPAGLDVRAQGRVPLQVLPTLRPEVRDAGGTLEVSARVSGSLSAPVLAGDGAIRGGRLLLRDRPETLRDIEARFAMSGQGIQLREASAAMGGGRVQARGDLALDGRALGPYRIQATARGVSLATIDGLSSTWDADLDLSGRGGEAWLQGGARLVRGVYTRDLSLLSMALSPARREEAVAQGRLHLFVRVRLDDNLAVRTRTADLRVGGALTVQGTTGAPVVFGAIEGRDGRIVFRGHDFTVQSASVRFADPRAVDPLLDVGATSRIREYEVTVQVSGRLSDLSVRLSSVPRLPPDDLVALVSFGVTRAELQGSPATVLAGETGKALAQSLLGIDPTSTGLRLSVVSSDDGRGDPYRIWEDDRDRSASATRRSGDRREKVRLEYRLLDPVYLSGEYDPEGGYGADVIFRLRFR